MAVCQSMQLSLTLRYRGQAPSHIWIDVQNHGVGCGD